MSTTTEDWRALRESPSVDASRSSQGGPAEPEFGTLVAPRPDGGKFTYRFAPEDMVWLARFIVGEAGGRDTAENRAVIWAMFNRYALLTHRYYPTFHRFIRAYSTPLQPVLRSWRAARRHMNNPSFVRVGGTYPPPATPGIPRGQLARFRKLQGTTWSKLPRSAREVARRAVTGQVQNPISNATEFGSTFVYFRDHNRRNPTPAEWRDFTERYAQEKKWMWIGPVPGLDQRENAFFVQRRLRNLPMGAVRVEPSTLGGGTARQMFLG